MPELIFVALALLRLFYRAEKYEGARKRNSGVQKTP